MFKKFEIQGVHTVVDDKLRSYVTRKLGNLDRYVARNYRSSAHMEVYLKENKKRGDNHCVCEVTLHLPKQNIIIKESSVNMYATVDIVSVKLKKQLQKYKEMHGTGKTRRHLFARLRRKSVI